MRVRRLQPGQEAEVIEASHLLDGTPILAAVAAYLKDNRNVFLLADEGGEPAGFLRGTELGQLESERKQMFLYEVGVGEKYRRRGAGTALVRELLRYCRGRGFEEVFVLTDPANEAAVELYRATGAVTETPADRMFVYRLRKGTTPAAHSSGH